MLSLTCKTAIKAVLYLAIRQKSDEKSGVKEIADHIRASEHTVGKLLQSLVKQKIIHSAKGPTGGFYITQEQLKLPIINIVETIDGPETFKECGLGLSKCSATRPCPIHHTYKEARDILENLFRRQKIGDLCKPVDNGLAYLIN